MSVSFSSWGLRRAAVCDCGTRLPFLQVGPKVMLASCKSALNPPPSHPRPTTTTTTTVVYSTDRSEAVVPVLVLLFVALWCILRGDLLYVFPCVILFLCFSVLLVLRLPHLGKTELILVLFVRLFDLCLFGFVGFLFLLGSGKGCGFVIVALAGLFSYLFFTYSKTGIIWKQRTHQKN